MSNDVLVRVEKVSKRFCRSLKRSLWYGLQDLGSEISGRRHGGGSGLPQSSADVMLRQDEFWAVKDVSFELRRGECLGLIGRNGAGKTTLLRMLNGLIKPDTGRIETRGDVRALIALGAGFNPILTGRENIHMATSILGMSGAETAALLDQIVAFAELESFIDSPVQSYSSGMQVRLGFASAIFLNPDIMILDEVLAVGDQQFRMKCMDAMRKKLPGMAALFVSHSATAIASICSSVLPMKAGASSLGVRTLEDGLLAYATEDIPARGGYFFDHLGVVGLAYEVRIHTAEQEGCAHAAHQIHRIMLRDAGDQPIEIDVHTGFRFHLAWQLGGALPIGSDFSSESISSRVVFQSADGSHPLQATCDLPAWFELQSDPHELVVEIGPVHLNRGRYELICGLFKGRECLVSCVGQVAFRITGRHVADLSPVLCDCRVLPPPQRRIIDAGHAADGWAGLTKSP